ncbi:MAG: lysophospholipid acyltransferase family protein [Saprospiraceae bacterium]
MLYLCPMHRLSYLFTRLAIELFRLVPFWLLYRLSNGLSFLLYRVIGYRRAVVQDNLRRSFPEKTEAERAVIARHSYRNLTDVMLETLKSYTLPVREIGRRCVSVNPDVLNRHLDQGQSVLLCGGHYGNWEYSGVAMSPCLRGIMIGSYKPIANTYMNAFVNHTRSRTGMLLVPMEDTVSVLRRRVQAGMPSVYLLLTDQSPSNRKTAQWVPFLNQDTPHLPGLDVLSRKFQLPVVFCQVQRVRRGFYEIEYSDIGPDPATANESDMTRAFAQKLESVIRERPEGWLWSHKRWKMKRP